MRPNCKKGSASEERPEKKSASSHASSVGACSKRETYEESLFAMPTKHEPKLRKGSSAGSGSGGGGGPVGVIRVADMIHNVQKEEKASFHQNLQASGVSSLEKNESGSRKNVVETLEENNKNIAKVLENYENLCKKLDIDTREITSLNNTQESTLESNHHDRKLLRD